MDMLEEEGWLENSVIVVASDNGGCPTDGGCNYPLRGAKQSVYEGGSKVPTETFSFFFTSVVTVVPFSQKHARVLLLSVARCCTLSRLVLASEYKMNGVPERPLAPAASRAKTVSCANDGESPPVFSHLTFTCGIVPKPWLCAVDSMPLVLYGYAV